MFSPTSRIHGRHGVLFILAGFASFLTGCASSPEHQPPTWPRYTLRSTQTTLLTPPPGKSFDASALLFLPDGSLLTLGNLHGTTPYRVEFLPGGREANLVPLTAYFPTNKVMTALGVTKFNPDAEGLALDDKGWIYLCEERHRAILRGDGAGAVERLPIDWSPVRDYFSKVESNASFEGVAVGDGRLYVANERSSPGIFEIDLASLRIKRDYVIYPSKSSLLGLHYSDLYYFENHLWILCRQHRVVLQMDAQSRRVVAEYDYREAEDRLAYSTGLPVGIMEGLAVDKEFIWLVTDNNGDDRRGARGDTRPTLIRCRRPGGG